MSEQVLGNQNLKEVISAACKVFNAVSEAKKNDGKIDLKDIYLLVALVPNIQVAVENVDQVVPEAKDLSVEEMADLVAVISADLGGLDADTKNKVEKVLLALKANYEAIKAF